MAEVNYTEQVIFYIVVTFLISCILKEIKKKTNIPFTPMILILGLVVGYFREYLWYFGDSTEYIDIIDGHSLLLIFIPGLVFEGAYNSDPYVFNKSKWQVIILAGPGVLMCTFLVALSFTNVLSYNLTYKEALVIGSIISTTDPVAVVALLKEIGAPIRFKTIIEGDSLLNDGSAYVFFLVCMDILVSG